jgi:hypothetical protein
MIGLGIGIVPRMSGSSVSVVTATVATGIGITSFTANWNAYTGAQYYLLDVSTSSSFATFVYQDQVVLAPTTSYVVIGLTENTTYYYRVRASTDPFVDVDYLAFYNRVINAGGSLTSTEQIATNQLVLDLKANSLWTPMKAIYPMVGGGQGTDIQRAAACSRNLKSDTFNGTFASDWTFASTGVTPNGTSAYFDSAFNASTNFSITSFSFGGYTSTSTNTNTDSYHGAAPPSYLMHSFKSYNLTELYLPNGGRLSVSGGITGMVQANQLLSTAKIYKNNTIGAAQTNVIVTLPNQNMYVGALNSNGTATFFDNHLISFYYYSDGLTDTQASDFYTAVQAFQTTLARQVV